MIELKNMGKVFHSANGPIVALDGIDLTINDGEIFGIIGLSGAGKSTLVRCINLLERPTSGAVLVDGNDLMKLPQKELLRMRRSIGMIFQGFNLLEQRNVIGNVCYPLEIAGVPKHEAKKRAAELIEMMRSYNVIPSMGHSVADAEETLRAIDAGASRCTHLFNGMQPLHQRDLGLASIGLTDNRVTAELIIDGRHVHPRMVDLACRCKRPDRIVGISDGTMAAMMPDGDYHIGKTKIKVVNGFSQTSSGALAGTTTMLNSGWHSLMSSGHLEETRAARAVTANPAEELKLDDRGYLRPGQRADLAVFERGTNRLLMTTVRGNIVYREGE